MSRDATPAAGEAPESESLSLARLARSAARRLRSLRRARAVQRARMFVLRGLAPLLEPLYEGVASIPVFHRVVAPRPGERVGFARHAEMSVAELESTIALFKRRGHAFVSLDELCAELGKPRARGAPRLAAVTFDDGYRDNHDIVYPLLSSLGIPFAIYVATSFPDRSHVPWWYLLEDRLLGSSSFAIEHEGRSFEWRLDGPAARRAAFLGTEALFAGLSPGDVRALAERTFGVEQVRRSMESTFLTWEMIRAMAASGQVTIGAHTIDHVVLPPLPIAEARAQVTGSKLRLEAQLGRPVRHFAYPFGVVGPRESDLVREAGFTSAATMCVANVFPEHASHLFTLPRVYSEFLKKAEPGDESIFRDELALQLRGALPALANRGRRVVTFGYRTAPPSPPEASSPVCGRLDSPARQAESSRNGSAR